MCLHCSSQQPGAFITFDECDWELCPACVEAIAPHRLSPERNAELFALFSDARVGEVRAYLEAGGLPDVLIMDDRARRSYRPLTLVLDSARGPGIDERHTRVASLLIAHGAVADEFSFWLLFMRRDFPLFLKRRLEEEPDFWQMYHLLRSVASAELQRAHPPLRTNDDLRRWIRGEPSAESERRRQMQRGGLSLVGGGALSLTGAEGALSSVDE